ncbi:MAG: hypothetical protein [Circular genetic element sp.]|nr:MAG: hypothetical protein [Circular genetic element sp.]
MRPFRLSQRYVYGGQGRTDLGGGKVRIDNTKSPLIDMNVIGVLMPSAISMLSLVDEQRADYFHRQMKQEVFVESARFIFRTGGLRSPYKLLFEAVDAYDEFR